MQSISQLFPTGVRSSGHVLVAGGRSEDRAQLRDVLSGDGHVVTLVRTAEDAIRALVAGGARFELVVLNVEGAPVSPELLTAITSCTPTVLLVDPSRTDEVARARMGAVTVIPEPYELDDVRVVVTSLVERTSRCAAN